jgi:phospholipid/cholesterol/gamma-HCH transport system substrate-binding protein
MKRAIKSHSGDFAAILVLLILSIGVSGYILHHERLRFPFFDQSQFHLNAEFSTAQAVTPGQGQTVRVSGVQVGDIGSVTLKGGVAIVQMNMDPKYNKLVHTDASALLRPKTGLKDMFIELNPGTKSAPVVKPGFTIPVSNTLPDINLDEVLSSLDGDTRAYLDLLVNGAGAGLKGRGNDLAQVLERFEPTHQDLARVSQAVALRGRNLSRLVNSLQRLNTALAAKRAQIVQLVDSSSKVFSAFASEDQNISRAIADFPATLRETTATLGKVTTFANTLGPTATNLLPAARALPAANAALTALATPSAPILQNEIRPFVVASRPLVRNLEPAAVNLAKATPNLSKTFVTLNQLFNMLGYNPGGAQHGYLWWLAWLDHNARTLFSQQDANGDFRPLFLEATCQSLSALNTGIAASGFALNFQVPILDSKVICPALNGGSARVTTATKTSAATGAAGGAASAPLSSTATPSLSSTTSTASTSTTSSAPTATGAGGSPAATTSGSSTASTTQTTTTH